MKNSLKEALKQGRFPGENITTCNNGSTKKIKHQYLGKDKPEDIIEQIEERKRLESELKKVHDALKILKRAEGKKHD